MSLCAQRWLERALLAVQWCLLLAAVMIIARGLTSRSGIPSDAAQAERIAAHSVASASVTAERPELRSIWKLDLRQDLLPPKPKPAPDPPPPPPSPPPLKLPRLLATFVEGGRAWAVLLETSGTQRVRAVGDNVELFEIAVINPGACTLRHADKTYELQVAKMTGSPKAVPGRIEKAP